MGQLQIVNAKFEPGDIAMTAGVNTRCTKDLKFNQFVLQSFGRHLKGDWGDLDDDDKRTNDAALKDGFRLMSAYFFNGNEEDKLWIITEWDRSVTTILFPSEY